MAVSRQSHHRRDLVLVRVGPFVGPDQMLAALTTTRRLSFQDPFIR